MSVEDTSLDTLSSLRAQTRNLPSDKATMPHLADAETSSYLKLTNGKEVHFGEIKLPSSKSESNRALMIAAYGGFAPDFQNLSDSNDTRVLMNALRAIEQSESIINIADCGTAARFLTTYLSGREGDWLLTGTERMKQRPIKPLVDALRILGADIQYAENDGFLPLHIRGKRIEGGKVGIDMSQSSQFASSLLLAAPMWPKGLELELMGSVNSFPYLELTVTMMRYFGAKVECNERQITVGKHPYLFKGFEVSPDWTAASYWYEMAAFSEECEVRLRGLSVSSTFQGDAVIAEWMRSFGVCTTAYGNGIMLTKEPYEPKPLSFDFTHHPDLYPTLVATCAGLGCEARFTGLENLRHKESDRVEAMKTELGKIGNHPLLFCSHNDHRVVMSLAPLSLCFGPVAFDAPEVVGKSYPGFWNEADFLQFR